MEDGILVETNLAKTYQKYKISFENIRKDELITVKEGDLSIILFSLSATFNAIFLTIILVDYFGISSANGKWVFLINLMILGILIGSLKEHFVKINIKILDADKPLNFIYTKKTKKEVDDFIALIKKEQKVFF